MAKIIDPDNYVPHNLPIPGLEKAKPFDANKYPAGLLSDQEARDLDKFVKQVRQHTKPVKQEPWK